MQYLILAAILLLDQIVKAIVRTSMVPYESIPVLGGVFNITYINNFGAAFSILQDKRFLLIAVTAAALIGLLLFLVIKAKNEPASLRYSLVLIIAGGSGNLIDRAVNGYVVDFIDFKIWPVFNIADVSIVCGCILMAIYVVLIDRKREREKKDGRR